MTANSCELGGIGAEADMTVSGAGTTFTTGSTTIGAQGSATLRVEGGAQLHTGALSQACCGPGITVSGEAPDGTPSRIVGTGELLLDGTTSTLTIEGGAEVQAASLAPTGRSVAVTIAGEGSLLEVTGSDPSEWGDAFTIGDDLVVIDLSDGAELRFSHPASQVIMSTGFGSQGILSVLSGSRFEAAHIQVGSAGFSFSDPASIFLEDGTVAATDEILLHGNNARITSAGTDVLDASVRYVNGATSVSGSLQVTGDVELGAREIVLTGATAQLEVLGDFTQTGEFSTFELFPVHAVQIGGAFTQSAGTLELRGADDQLPAPIQVEGPVELRGTIHVVLNFPPDGTRYELIQSATSAIFDGDVTWEGLGAQQAGVFADLVGSRVDLVVPEPGAAGASFAAFATLVLLAGIQRARRRSSEAPARPRSQP